MAVLISGEYLKEQRRMHRNARYGAAAKKFSSLVKELIIERKPASILDYGAGKGSLGEILGFLLVDVDFRQYDPGVKAIAKRPKTPADMVCCIDVLEHIEPKHLDEVIDHIRSLTSKWAFMTIHTGPAGKFLSDGRNAHLIQQPIGWWVELVGRRFREVRSEMVNETTAVLVCEV